MDPITILWLNAFALNLQRSVKKLSVEQTEPPYLVSNLTISILSILILKLMP
jgi:hypothetical protein